MLTLILRGRALVAALIPVLLAPALLAATEASPHSEAGRAPAGNPELGMLIILGAIGFFILLAWIFARMGDGGKSADNTLP